MEPSGITWCSQFPTSTSLTDLAEPFRTNAGIFIDAIRAAGALVTVSATYRPPERAYLMHWCCQIANGNVAPGQVPAMSGVDIDWTHGADGEDAHTAAILMKHEYDIEFPAALVSRHTQRRAIDMTIHFNGGISVRDAHGAYRQAACQSDLWPIGATYDVIKLPSDAPHWSDDGH